MRKTIRLLFGCAVSMAMFHTGGAPADQKFHITVLSSRPEMVSGGDALVQIAVPPDAALDQATIRLNGQDVSAMFHSDPAGAHLEGVGDGSEGGREHPGSVSRQQRAGATSGAVAADELSRHWADLF